MEEKTVTIIIDNEVERADSIIARLTGATRTLIANHILNGFVTFEGNPIKKSTKFKLGDKLSISFQPEPVIDLTPKDIAFDIIYDTKNYAIINKPAFLTVHPSSGHYNDTLVNALLYKFKIDFDDDDFRPGIVHRLDKDTSGLMIISKNYDAKLKLSRLFADRLIKKKYLAIMHGNPKFNILKVDKPIARDKSNRKRMAIDIAGKEAVSIFTLVEKYKDTFLSSVDILTGRTHQIRVHAKSINHALVGDILYGGKMIYGFNRQALTCSYLSFKCPYTSEIIEATLDMPDDMKKLIDELKR